MSISSSTFNAKTFVRFLSFSQFRRSCVMLASMIGFGLIAVQPAAAEKGSFAEFSASIARTLNLGEAAAKSPAAAIARTATPAQSDPKFRALFDSWKKLDALSQGVISIPSSKPVEGVSFTSAFGVRSDPFRGTAAMHAGIDLAGPTGTPIYATADGVVDRAGWASGYGNLIEVDHGKGIETRFGHLSKILVKPNSRVKRGQLIGLMGSTGRSTGSHLHYEVRIDGRAVNPVPYIQSADYAVAVQQRIASTQVAIGGPED